jgi:predicted TIM-barrel fold metal-dependent hydrolase
MLPPQVLRENRNTSGARRIDTHAHLVPDFYRLWLLDKRVDAGGLPIPNWSARSTLQFMEANEIETSILSVATPGVEPGAFDEARRMARRLNEFAATLVSESRHRFGFFATLMLPDVADFLLDSVRAAINLSHTGVMDRCPNLKIILSHAGGFLPYCAERLSMHASPKSSLEDGLRILRRFGFDTALASTKFSMPSLLAFADPTHITYGSDFPYAPPAIGSMFTKELDSYRDCDHHAINRRNASQLFPKVTKVS